MAFPNLEKIVLVEWTDSNMANGWHLASDMEHTVAQGALACRSVGYLFLESDDRIVLVGDQSDAGAVCNGMTIPRVAITRMTVLSEATP